MGPKTILSSCGPGGQQQKQVCAALFFFLWSAAQFLFNIYLFINTTKRIREVAQQVQSTVKING
jgi:hypothetical protein